MATFTAKSNSQSGRYLQLTITQTKNIEKNTSTLKWTLTSTGGQYEYYMVCETTVKINGTQVYHKDLTQWNTYVFPAKKGSVSGEIEVEHNDDGSLSVPVVFKTAVYDSAYLKDYGGTFVLDDNPRQATLVSASNFTDEENPTITYENLAGESINSLQACIKDSTGATILIPYRDIDKTGSSYQFILTDEERDILRNYAISDDQYYVNFCVKTVIGDDSYVSDLTRILTIVNANPTVTGDVVDNNPVTTALTGDSNIFIKGYSTAQCTVQSTALKGANLTKYRITYGSKSETYFTNLTTVDATHALTNVIESANFYIRAYDTRGNSTVETISKTLIEYVKLTCNLNANNPTAEGNMSFMVYGNYFNGLFGNEGVAVNNTLALAYRYKVNDGEYGEWTTITPTITDNAYSCTVDLTGLDYRAAYTIQAKAVDLLNTEGVSSTEKKVKSTPVFDWGENDFTVNGELIVNNDIIANGRVICQPQAKVLGFTSTTSVTLADTVTDYKVTFSTLKVNIGDKLAGTSSGVQVKSGSGISYVRVGGNIMIRGITGVNTVKIRHYVYDEENGYYSSTVIMQGYYTAPNDTEWGLVTFSPQVRAVTEKDYFGVSLGSEVTGTLSVAGGTYSYLSVEAIY